MAGVEDEFLIAIRELARKQGREIMRDFNYIHLILILVKTEAVHLKQTFVITQ